MPTCALPDGQALRQLAHITQSLLSTCLRQQQQQQKQQQQQQQQQQKPMFEDIVTVTLSGKLQAVRPALQAARTLCWWSPWRYCCTWRLRL
jgi:hypothetical protein